MHRREAEALDHEADLLPLVEDEEVLLRDVVLGRHQHRLQRDEAHQLRAGHGEVEGSRFLRARLERHVRGRRLVVLEVDRDLGEAVLLDPPPDGANRLQAPRLAGASALLAHVQRDAVGLLLRPEDVHVVGDQEVARARARGSPLRHELGRAVVGRPLRLPDPLRDRLVLPRPDLLERAAVVGPRRVAVEVDGDAQLGGRPPAELVREGHAVVHRHARHRNEGADVHRADPGVLALLRPHVDPEAADARGGERALDHGRGLSDEGVDGAVRGRAGVHVEQGAPGRRPDRVGDRVDHGPVAALREVRHALDELSHDHSCCRRHDNAACDSLWSFSSWLVGPSVAAAPVPPAAQTFPLRDVRILDGPFRDAQQRDLAYLLSLDPDRLLHTFRLNAGLPTTAKPYGGWEAPSVELRGHSLGHYLTACALLYEATGDERLKARALGLVAELRKVQQALPSRGMHPGYLSAFPEELFDRVEARKGVWAPYYTLHKIMAGLLDVHRVTGDPAALEAVKEMAAWVGLRAKGLDRRAVAGDARDRVRRDAGRPDGALRHDGGPGAPAARPPLRPPERLRPPRPRRGPARRPAREHADPEGHRRRPRLRDDRRAALLRGRRDVLAAGRAAPLLRDRGPQRGRALLPGRAPLAPPRRVHRRDLQHLQHAEAHAPALPPGRRPGADRVLRARPLQPHPRLAGPRHGDGHVLRRAEAGGLAQLLDARGLVLVLRGDRDGEPGPLRRGDLRAPGRRPAREPLPRLRAHVEGEGPRRCARRRASPTRTGRGSPCASRSRRASPCACATRRGRRTASR